MIQGTGDEYAIIDVRVFGFRSVIAHCNCEMDIGLVGNPIRIIFETIQRIDFGVKSVYF